MNYIKKIYQILNENNIYKSRVDVDDFFFNNFIKLFNEIPEIKVSGNNILLNHILFCDENNSNSIMKKSDYFTDSYLRICVCKFKDYIIIKLTNEDLIKVFLFNKEFELLLISEEDYNIEKNIIYKNVKFDLKELKEVEQ